MPRRGRTGARMPSRVYGREKTRAQHPALIEDPDVLERSLKQTLKSHGLYAAHTLGDGNCMFRALSDQVYGTPGYYHQIRKEVCDFLEEREERYRLFVDSDSTPGGFAGHVASMRRDGTYGTNIELAAFANLVRRPIKVYQPNLVYVVSPDDVSPSPRKQAAAAAAAAAETEGPLSAKEKRARKKALDKGKAKEVYGDEGDTEETGPVYVAYYTWEHYSSIRNINGPHTGLPNIHEVEPEEDEKAEATATDDSEPTEADKLLLATIPAEQRATLTLSDAKQLIAREGGWEAAAESLIAAGNQTRDSSPSTSSSAPSRVSASTSVTSPDEAPERDTRRSRSRLPASHEAPSIFTQPPDDENSDPRHVRAVYELRRTASRGPSVSDDERSSFVPGSRQQSPVTSTASPSSPGSSQASTDADGDSPMYMPDSSEMVSQGEDDDEQPSSSSATPAVRGSSSRLNAPPRGPTARERREIQRKRKLERKMGRSKARGTMVTRSQTKQEGPRDGLSSRVRELFI